MAIGKWVLQKSCSQLEQWNKSLNPSLRMNINISCRQFRDENFINMLRQIVNETSVNPKNLTLEITESLFLEDDEGGTLLLLQEIRSLGLAISLDDFGTGYSSLSYLKRFPIDIIKIDQSFIQDLSENTSDQSLVKAIISMAQSLNLKVVAEGVETLDQLHFLQAQGCDTVQGYLYCKPASPNVIGPLINSPLIKNG
jgi:EAL domain-containing protein (putative c-di-GMP-specific phosphodiesterase class I)